MFVAPADSPAIVILFGSPPTKWILFFIHFNADIISNKAKLDLDNSGCEKKPKIPSRYEIVTAIIPFDASLSPT